MHKLSQSDIEGKIKDVDYLNTQQLTFAIVTVENGFQVAGQAGVIDPERFDFKIGSKVAKQRAISELWQLEGYLAKEKDYNLSSVAIHTGKVLWLDECYELREKFNDPAFDMYDRVQSLWDLAGQAGDFVDQVLFASVFNMDICIVFGGKGEVAEMEFCEKYFEQLGHDVMMAHKLPPLKKDIHYHLLPLVGVSHLNVATKNPRFVVVDDLDGFQE